MSDQPYLVKTIPEWKEYQIAETGIPGECNGCKYEGPGTQYCNNLQQLEFQRQWLMHCGGEEPQATEEFHLDCPKELQKRQEDKAQREKW